MQFPFVTTGSPAHLNPGTTVLVALTPSLLWGAALLSTFLLAPAETFPGIRRGDDGGSQTPVAARRVQ